MRSAVARDRVVALRQTRDIARYLVLNPDSKHVLETVQFNLLLPINVMNTIQT